MEHSILILDGVDGTSPALDAALKRAGYQVNRVEETAEAIARCEHCDMLLMAMPTRPDPYDVFIKAWSLRGAGPVMILQAPDGLDDALHALELGADDFICQGLDWDDPDDPSARELLARIAAAVRRHARPQSNPNRLALGRVALDIGARTATVADKPVLLTPREFDLLTVLIRAEHESLTVRDILDRVWGSASLGQTHYVHVYVSRLRGKLDAANAGLRIDNRSGHGYRIAVQLAHAEDDPN